MEISKNIYFSLQNPQERSGRAGWEGRGGEAERVHWFTEGCWTGMSFPRLFKLKTTIPHLQLPAGGPRELRPVSSFAIAQVSVDISSRSPSSSTIRIPSDPVLSDTPARKTGVPGSVTAQITARVYRMEL